MTRTERAWHWKLWLCIAPVLGMLITLALWNRPASTERKMATSEAREVRP